MWEELEEKIRELFRLCNGKKVCIWGYNTSGRFCEYLFRRAYKTVEYIIDDSPVMKECYRSVLLRECDPDLHIVLLTFERDENVVNFLTQLGYKENLNFVFVKEWFYGREYKGHKVISYLYWLENKYGLDIMQIRLVNELEKVNIDTHEYVSSTDADLMKIMSNFEIKTNDAIFDFGCGKGGAIFLFLKMGIGRVGGVEFDSDLYQICLSNFRKMGVDSSDIMNEDAAQITDVLDDYNYFYIYNSFEGKTFENVVKHLEESYERNKRKMYLIYSNPYCHSTVVRNGVFKLSKVIETNFYIKYAKIYSTRQES